MPCNNTALFYNTSANNHTSSFKNTVKSVSLLKIQNKNIIGGTKNLLRDIYARISIILKENKPLKDTFKTLPFYTISQHCNRICDGLA